MAERNDDNEYCFARPDPTTSATTSAIRNFDEAAAKGGQGFMGIKIDPKQAVLVKASNYATAPNPFQAWDFDPTTFAAGADSSITEHNGKSFTVYLQQGASANSTLILNIAGAVGQGLKAILGDSVVDANGASIELSAGQTQVSFSLVSDSDITADQAGAITVNYQSSGAGAGNGFSTATSNVWGLSLKDAGETENTLEGDFLVKTEKAWFDFIRLDAQGQQIVVVKTDELYYVRDSQGNLVAGSPSSIAALTQTDASVWAALVAGSNTTPPIQFAIKVIAACARNKRAINRFDSRKQTKTCARLMQRRSRA